MALNYFKVEQGIKITEAASETGVLLLIGAGAPTLDAPIGSLYSDETAGGHYQKVAAGAGAENWKELATKEDVQASIGTWRPERVVCVTADFPGFGDRDMVASPFSDDQGTKIPIADFVPGKYVIASNLLMKIMAKVGDVVTFDAAESAMVKDDTFVCEYYLPDIDGQENLAIVNYNGSVMVKIADADWGRADAIGLSPSYTVDINSISSGNTVQEAIQSLDGRTSALVELSGELPGTLAHTIPSSALPGNTHGVDVGDNVLTVGNDLALFTAINKSLSHLNQWTTGIGVADTWVDVFHLTSGISDAMSMKLAIQFEPSKTGATLPVVALELMSTHSLAVSLADCSSDFTIYAKVKTDKRNGVAVTEDFNPELRFNVTTNLALGSRRDVALQIKLPAGYSYCNVAVRPLFITSFLF